MSQTFHKFWLMVTAVTIGAFGPIFFLGTMDSTLEPARFTLDLLNWPLDGSSTYASHDTKMLSALAGGFLVGWGVMVACLRGWIYDLAPEAVRKTVVVSVLAWFVLDSAGSVASGATSNALFNVFFLLLAVGPLWRPARQ